MDPLIGKTLSHFRVLDKIGAGGMGVVYRARDEQLRRDVAIKVLPQHALADEAARNRFRHEALTLSRLNHPNIETVLGFDTQDGVDFLIMEYVDGMSLEDKLRSGALPEDEAIGLAVGVAEALEAAHSKGVIHCDLKPANVGLRSDGRVKVFDFGIAQVLRSPRDDSTTQTLLDNVGGGTLPYMAPEQLLGKQVDGRVDLYALGVLLFRMTTGRVPFTQPMSTALTDDILHRPPPSPRSLNPKLSPRLELVILRCLEKDPASRYQTAADLRADLGRLKRDSELAARGVPVDSWAPQAPPRKPRLSRAVLWSAAAIGALAVLWFAVLRDHPIPLPSRPDRQVTFTGQASEPAISPDGQYAAYIDRSGSDEHRLLVQDLAGGEALKVFSARACTQPRWSPDGSTILCQAVRDSEETAVLVPRLGGRPRSLPSGGYLHSWASDGRRFVSTAPRNRRLLITDTVTGDTSSVPLDGFSARIVDVDWSPREDRIVVLATDDRDQYSFWTMIPGREEMRKWFDVPSEATSPRWGPDGDAIYFFRVAGEGGLKDLCKTRWTSRTRRASVQPEVLLKGLVAGDYFSLSRDGRRLLYTREAARSNLWSVDLDPHQRDASRREKPITTGTSYDTDPALSPDGKSVAFVRGAGPMAEIFRVSVDGGEAQQLTFMNSGCRSPVWSPVGDTIAFVSNKGGPHRLWRVAANGGPARPYPGVEVSSDLLAPVAWAPGDALLCKTSNDRDYLLLDTRTGKGTSIGSPDSLGFILYPQFSPDGGRVAWWSAGPRGVWVMTLADGRRVRVLREGPVLPLAWTEDGRWIYAWDSRAARTGLLRFRSDGGRGEEHVEIPLQGHVDGISVSPGGARAVCAVSFQQPDVWLAENFDRRAR